MPHLFECVAADSVSSLENDGCSVMGVDEAAAGNQLEAEAGLGKGDGVKVGVGVEELPLADVPLANSSRPFGSNLAAESSLSWMDMEVYVPTISSVGLRGGSKWKAPVADSV